ncbi:MAG TPA: 4-aminobutyrate--2-oxoglutarate transaminase [Pseudomonas sp.]|uniref:4-aminobutyrate--2-oxoglutarate transaminase n=1 Tax=Halopseudomonas pachastrellae TaxID=254161 RepID=A0A1S8DIS8_9GAMM|nr:4-aminobutyrate--2-oxoglutarate transaminase [Halopseudomonas pachastrellae]MAQ52119.1 4-aminobutyrate--2-oxoglutarate transaminase [Pseudomonas sp.]MBB52152.1 4-aminobutyrate--2-oxoglutarate transaminase [Pseudomonadales bacterium]ONM44769.1 4-aminobutyrate--2-oxoglutarate transaminase [Halopseudomonas pachastrellae]SFM42085.1 5-aminovalerate/4-aminobutyrate aminotransferase [Halopseudomonas pachastrellae]HCA24237.1 4-aminobutyrate--2-oxoglutarate transaminase [Pseudomonas sp.]|tara:strand:- start:1615 stop:2886 length:1272 start_codon:yes stop_codon:yes gene_type:complete
MSKSNESLMQRRQNAVARGVSQIHPIAVQRAENATVWDVEGRQYIDFAGGIAVLNTGHRHPKVMDAVRRQLDQFTHTCFQVLAYEPYIALCERLNEMVPGDFAKKTLLVTTGSEALENAVKIARAATGRAGVIAFTGAYHGRTMMTLSMTGKVAPYSAGMGLMPGGVYRAQYPCPLHGVSDDDAIASIERIFKNDAQPQDIAAIVIEPVQGEGGFYVASPAFMQRLRALCDQHGILLVADEVQTGAGRTGTFFAMEQMGVAADLTTFAKSIAGGFPVAGVCGRAEAVDSIAPGGLGGTYAGSPLACAAALAVMDVFEEENLLARSRTVGEILTGRLSALATDDKRIGDVRGLGAMVACELFTADGAPDAELTGRIVAAARDKGLILLSCGQYGNVIRILVPLTATDVELNAGMDIIAECFAEL